MQANMVFVVSLAIYLQGWKWSWTFGHVTYFKMQQDVLVKGSLKWLFLV